MPFAPIQKSVSEPEIPPGRPVRPKFHHRCTNDRIREGFGRPSSFPMSSKITKNRKSVFRELGLDTDEPSVPYSSEHEYCGRGLASPTSTYATEPSNDDPSNDRESDTETNRAEQQMQVDENEQPTSPSTSRRPWYSRLTPSRRPRIKTVSSAPPPSLSTFTRLSAIALLIAVVLPGFSYFKGHQEASFGAADAGVIQNKSGASGPVLEPRAESPTKACKRWAHQTAQLNGTLYIYGGQAKTTEDQTTDTWNNNFLVLDLTTSWDAGSPALRGLPQPSGPPAVALGYLWNDYNNLYLYGGQFADNPFVRPAPVSMWKYAIRSREWIEYPSPRTSAGVNSDVGDQPVQRAAEGAGLSVPELGLSWYFGGHLDQSTTPGWSDWTPRVYLKSLLEFTHPGYTNDAVFALADGTGAGDGGVYRNITEGGLQKADAFPERADGVLVYVPGWGEKGVLIGLAGGAVDTFTDDLETLDVFDIATSEWYHQQTTGDTPSVRVNPCAVVASAPDASSFQIYLYGGQNLQPYRNQTQYSDMYILSIPSFTWIRAPQSGHPVPAPRAGHTCNLRDGQIIVVGGYTSPSHAGCEDAPASGIFVFNASSLAWQPAFYALDHPPDHHPDNSVLANSYGYSVPDAVAEVIGGDAGGGATATTPSAGPATGGPFATGKPPVFTVTASGPGGGTATVTKWGPGATGAPSPPGGGGEGDGRRAGLIAAGVIAGLAGLAAAYLGYCAWLYRRQVRAYKKHLEVANRYSYNPVAAGAGEDGAGAGAGVWGRGSSTSGPAAAAAAAAAAVVVSEKGKSYETRPRFSTSTVDSFGLGGSGLGWPPTEPRFLFDDDRPSPGSGRSGSGSGSGSGPAVRGAGATAVPTSKLPRRSASISGGSTSSTERLLDGQEPSFISVVMGPRRALRVVNGLEGDSGGE
ncbi:Kelch repeat-containing protein [Madurella fahalii]|uniref:Kelch repeat-containing protein n=1 Tax=Madurella fahalii TaxID=1157608 RepID=A0ABQ0GN90_9PEZI